LMIKINSVPLLNKTNCIKKKHSYIKYMMALINIIIIFVSLYVDRGYNWLVK
jgi:hypothetical protein